MPFSRTQHEDERSPLAICAHMQFGAEAATAASERLAVLATASSGRVLVGANDRAVDEVHRPIQQTPAVGLPLEGAEDLLPQAGFLPAIEPAGDSMPRAEAPRQVSPWRSSGENPEDAVEQTPMRVRRTAHPAMLGRQQRNESTPLLIRQFVSTHAS
jgi:hypothetical protein